MFGRRPALGISGGEGLERPAWEDLQPGDEIIVNRKSGPIRGVIESIGEAKLSIKTDTVEKQTNWLTAALSDIYEGIFPSDVQGKSKGKSQGKSRTNTVQVQETEVEPVNLDDVLRANIDTMPEGDVRRYYAALKGIKVAGKNLWNRRTTLITKMKQRLKNYKESVQQLQRSQRNDETAQQPTAEPTVDATVQLRF